MRQSLIYILGGFALIAAEPGFASQAKEGEILAESADEKEYCQTDEQGNEICFKLQKKSG